MPLSEVPIIMLSIDNYDRIERMRDVLMKDPNAPLLLEGEKHEYSILWIDPETGILSKAKIDQWSTHINSLVDIKTTTDASRYGFARSVFKYGYYFQGAMYLRGLNALEIDIQDFTIIAQEKEPPFAVGCYTLDDDAIELGYAQLDYLMERFERFETGELDSASYSNKVEILSLPRWSVDVIHDLISR